MELVDVHLFQGRHEKEPVYFIWKEQMTSCINTFISYFSNSDTKQGV